MAYFIDYLILSGNISLSNDNDTIGIYFLKSKYRTKGYYKKRDIENTFGLLIPYLNFNLSQADTNPTDKVLLYIEDTQQEIGEYEILSRETVRNTKSLYEGKIDFNWYKNNDEIETIDCSLHYTDNEMNWIKVGISPIEMEDRIIMFVDEDECTINFFGSWQGYGLFKAFFRKNVITENINSANSILQTASFEVYRLIAVKRPYRDRKKLLEDFISQIKYHFNTLEYAKSQQEIIKLQLQRNK